MENKIECIGGQILGKSGYVMCLRGKDKQVTIRRAKLADGYNYYLTAIKLGLWDKWFIDGSLRHGEIKSLEAARQIAQNYLKIN